MYNDLTNAQLHPTREEVMGKLTYNLNLNADGTLTIKVGRYRETITLACRSKGEVWDQVKWALISKDVYLGNDRLMQDMYDEVWSKLL